MPLPVHAIFLLLLSTSCLPRELPAAVKPRNSEQCRKQSYGPRCEVPIHHLLDFVLQIDIFLSQWPLVQVLEYSLRTT